MVTQPHLRVESGGWGARQGWVVATGPLHMLFHARNAVPCSPHSPHTDLIPPHPSVPVQIPPPHLPQWTEEGLWVQVLAQPVPSGVTLGSSGSTRGHVCKAQHCCSHSFMSALVRSLGSPSRAGSGQPLTAGPPRPFMKTAGAPAQQPHKGGTPGPPFPGGKPPVTEWARRLLQRSPGAGLAGLRGVGAQVQPPQVVHLGLARRPDREEHGRG